MIDIESWDDLKPKGRVTIEVWDKGELVKELKVNNLVVTSGRNMLRDLLGSAGVAGITHFAVGINNTTPVLSHTSLAAEVGRKPITQYVRSVDNQLTVRAYFGSSELPNPSSLKEAGLFNASSGGSMYSRIVHSPITKTSDVAMTYTWTLFWS